MMLHYQDPAKFKTKEIVFEHAFAANDSFTLEQLKELTSKRKLIEESINESSSTTEAIAREMSGGLTSPCEQDLHKLEQYLPLLQNLIFHAYKGSHSCIYQWTSDLKIRWTSALSPSSSFILRGAKFFQIDNLRFELVMTLFLFGAMLRNKALEVLPIDLVQSATLFREAAGVYHHLANELLPSLQSSLPVDRPPEVIPSVSNAMNLICLAEAQAVAVRRAEEKGTTLSLLAKLHQGVVKFLADSEGALFTYTSTRECKDISSRFVDFVSSFKALHELKSRRYLAESLKTAGQIGVSLGVLRPALTEAKRRKLPVEESWKAILSKDIDDVAELLRKFEHENEFVWNEKVPSEDELPPLEGNQIVSEIAYVPKRWERALVFKI